MIFVGRRSELDALDRLLDGALRGSGAVAMLSGDPGIGKTRTAEEFATAARSRGASVIWAKCFEGLSLPYAPWPAALAGDWPQESGLPALSAEDERLRLFEAVSAGVCNRQNPLILILDDLHLAQPSALQLLEHVSHSVPNAPVLVIGTHSDVGVDLAHPLTRCLAELRRNAVFVGLELEPLTSPEVRALVEALAEGEPDAALLRQVEKETAGNPFFITEVVTHLDAGGTIPATIRQAVGGRLARLSVNTNRILSLASAFSDAFDFRAVQAASDLPEEAVLEAVDEGLTARIIRPAGGERYEFAHRLFQQTLQQELSPSRRSRLHRRIVRAFEQLAAEGFDLPAAELARQYEGSR